MHEKKLYEPNPAEMEKVPGEINPELSKFYFRDGEGRLLNALYNKTTTCPGYEGATIPPMRFGKKVDDIIEDSKCCRYVYPDYSNPIYDDSGMDIGYHEIKILGGLKEYIVFTPEDKPPLYISDNHNHALFAWQECREAGILSDNSILVRFDNHLDMSKVKPRDLGELSRAKIKNNISNDGLRGIDIENFTRFAFDDGLIGEMHFVHGELTKSEDEEIIKKTNDLSDAEEEIKVAFLSPILFEGGLEEFKKALERLKNSGNDIILDIDFDVFTKNTPEDKALLLEQAILEALKYAKVITCATSPGYGNHTDNVKKAKRFVKEYLERKINE